MGRNNTYAALRADAASTENAEELAALIMLMTNSPELGRRASAARPDISQLAQHRIDATAAGQAMQNFNLMNEFNETTALTNNANIL